MKKFDSTKAQATVIEQEAPQTPAPVAPSGGGGALALIGGYQPPALPPEPEDVAYLAFREKSTQDAFLAKIVAALGMVPEGTPLVVKGDSIVKPDGFAFALLTAEGLEPLTYWATAGGENYRPDRVWLQNPGVRAVPGEDEQTGRITESVRAVLLVLPGTSSLPEHLAPAALVTVRLSAAKAQAISDLSRAAMVAQTADWARANAKLAQVPPAFRMVGTLRVGSKTIKSGPRKGKSYGTANMVCSPVSVAQLDALSAWNASPEALVQIEAAKTVHGAVVSELRDLAAKTAPITA